MKASEEPADAMVRQVSIPSSYGMAAKSLTHHERCDGQATEAEIEIATSLRSSQ